MEQRTLRIEDRIFYCYDDGSVEYYNKNKKQLVKNFGNCKNRQGYRLLASISVNHKPRAFSVHRLIAMAFLPNPGNLPFVDHINRDKSDNRACNLRWCTHEENLANTYTKSEADAKFALKDA